MKPSSTKFYSLVAIIYTAVFAIYNIIIFTAFKGLNGVFWVSYVCMLLTFFANIAVVLLSTKNTEAAFFGIPLIYISNFHMGAELFASLVFMGFRNHVSIGLALIVQVVLFLIIIIAGCVAIFAKDAATSIEQNVKTNVANIKLLATDVKLLEDGCTDAQLKAQLHIVNEAIYYSNPMSNESVAQLDQMIASKVQELKYYCQSNDKNSAMDTCFKLQAFVKERNAKLLITK